MRPKTTARFVREVVVEDPDTGAPVPLAVYREAGGGMFAIDSSYVEQMEPATVPSVFENGRVLLEGD